FHYGGRVIEREFPNYEGKLGVRQCGIDLDHFSLIELDYYSCEIGYYIVEGFYYQDTKTKQFKVLKIDSELLGLVSNLKHGYFLDIFIKHVVDNDIVVENMVPTTFITGSQVIENESEANLDTNPSVIGAVETDLNGSDSEDLDFDEDLEHIPEEDDSDVDEESREFREKQRQQK
ncbi:hypothetical protein A4A49_60308, partial [Nicotiana attenuata]